MWHYIKKIENTIRDELKNWLTYINKKLQNKSFTANQHKVFSGIDSWRKASSWWSEYAVVSDKRLAVTGLSASVNEDKQRTSTGNSLESIDHPHAGFLKYKTNKCLDLDKMIWLMVLSAKVPEDTREYPIETSILFPIKIEEKSIQEYNWKMHWSLLNIRKTQHLDSDTSHFEKQSWFWWKPYNCCYSWRRNCCGKF